MARQILAQVGMADAPDFVVDLIVENGGSVSSAGRLLFGDGLIEKALAGICREFVLHGRKAGQGIHFFGHKVHVGTGGAAPMVFDLQSGSFRPSQLKDIHTCARLVNALDHVHFFSRPLVARDVADEFGLDVNTAFACLSGTTKPIFTSAASPESVEAIAEMCFKVAGSRDEFSQNPFLALNINHAVPPLRFHAEACAVMRRAAALDIPFHVNTFGQVGASEPVALAGSLAQTTAETLAGMILGWCFNHHAKMTFGARPMVTDLRTGAMAGGGGEQALVMAAAIQMAKYYGLPDTCIAGATDSKIADAQSGYEKCLSITLAAQAGSNAITQAAGTQASLMAASLESFVIDNDMLGSILRSVNPIEISERTLDLKSIEAVATGPGHYFGEADTLDRMHSDFLYPTLADRQSIEQWQHEGRQEILARAIVKKGEILSASASSVLDETVEADIRARFDILLD